MIRPVRSRAKGLFDIDNLVSDFNDFEVKVVKTKTKRESSRPRESKANEESHVPVKTNFLADSKKAKMSNAKKEFLDKLEDKLFNQFTKKDWLMYWQHKAQEHGINYIILKGNYPKEYAVLGSLMNNFQTEEIKLMLDFLWDCDHDIHDKRTMGTWILSKGWINSVYQNMLLWKDGQYKTRAELNKQAYNKPVRNREWVDESPDTPEDKPKKGSKIRF